jgi:hypothetical protein
MKENEVAFEKVVDGDAEGEQVYISPTHELNQMRRSIAMEVAIRLAIPLLDKCEQSFRASGQTESAYLVGEAAQILRRGLES